MAFGDAPLLLLLRELATPRRRDLLRLAAAGAAGATIGACGRSRDDARGAAPLDAAAPVAPPPLRVLTAVEARAIEAATARILPSEPDFPGAREAGVVHFIDGQLTTAELAPASNAIRALGQLLDAVAGARHHRPFAELDDPVADGILAELAAGTLPIKKPLPQTALFRALHTLTLEGYLADPRHGGNRDEIGWRAVGFATPPLREPGGGHGGHGP